MLKNLFLCSIPSCKYHFKSGKEANFIKGEYVTTIQSEIDELNEEVALGHQHISIDPNRVQIDVDADPLKGLRDKIRADVLAELAAQPDEFFSDKSNVAEKAAEDVTTIESLKAKTLSMGTTANVQNAKDSNSPKK